MAPRNYSREKRRVLVLLVLLSQASCVPRATLKDGWLTSTEDLPKERLKERWLPVEPSRFSWVIESRSRMAEEQLEAVDFVEVPDSEVTALVQASDTSFSLRPGLRAFVVRGACFGSQPTFATVQISESSNTVHVYQGTDEPEIYLPGAMRSPPVHKRPMLLLLEEAPGAVLATADYGGDRVLRWFHPSNSKWFPSSRVRRDVSGP